MHLVRGQGSHLFDADGARYLDAYNNVASVGHCHPHVADAVAEQLATLNTHTRYLHRGIVDYSERLLATMPAEVDQVMYACTGSEVNDLALRVAEMHTGATGVVDHRGCLSRQHRTAVTAISPSLGGATSVGANVRVVPPPDTYRVPADELAHHASPPTWPRAVDDLARGRPRRQLPDRRHDLLLGRDLPRPVGARPGRRRRYVAAAGVFIADEVQPGFARTGASMWGFARHGVVPDVVTMGKPMGNGMPVAAMAARADVLKPFALRVPYFNTFGGNPVSMAAASAVLDVIERRRPDGQRRDGG